MRIEDYGFLSDTETAALVGKNGSIDWLCMPRFDSPACFAQIVGDAENGFWQVAPSEEVTQTSRQYRDGTLILETEFTTAGGKARLVDCMPVRDDYPDVVRVVEGLEGEVAMRMQLSMRFDYGNIVPWVQRDDGEIIAIAGPNGLVLRSDVPTRGEGLTTVAEFRVGKGETVAFVLTWFPSHRPTPGTTKTSRSLAKTERFWRKWSKRAHRCAPWDEAVKRSLLVLKGLTYAPTGGIVAAPTTSLPEKIGGSRNWDYRFCWLRDATFTLYALLDSGYTEEAEAWRDWLVRTVAGSADQLQIVYGAAGERDLRESEISHLAGYENSRPVRIGNGAVNQFQLDVYGEVMDVLHLSRREGIEPDEWSWRLQLQLVDFVMSRWREPDEGIWEVRGGPRHFTHSKVMAWVALDRAVKGAEDFGLCGDAKKWRSVRDEIHREICARGFNEERGSFTQSFGCDGLDASLLMIPLVGFLPPEDYRVRATVEAIAKELMCDGFVMRYHPDDSGPVDGLTPGEGAFLPCSFWLADCLNLMGRRDEAVELFERLLSLRNDLGLLAEEYDPQAKRQLGNFPQAFSHVALVNTASNLGRSKGPAKSRAQRNGDGAK